MVYYEDITFDFAEPAPEPVKAGLIFLMVVYGITVATVMALLIRGRHNQLLKMRGIPTLLISLAYGYVTSVVLTASIILGKPLFCEALGFLYAAFVPMHTLHLFLLQPIILAHYHLNAQKENRARGQISWQWALKKYLSNRAQVAYVILATVVVVAVYAAVHWGVPARLEGDCNRDAQLLIASFALFLVVFVMLFSRSLMALKDPYFFKEEVVATSLSALPVILLALMYPMNPHLFPPSFDYRHVSMSHTLLCCVCCGILPLLLAQRWVQRLLRPADRHQHSELELRATQTAETLFIANTSKDLFLACLENPTMLKSFTKYTTHTWCVENVLFYSEIQTFKKTPAAELQERGEHIVNEFVTHGAPLEVNIDDHTRKTLGQHAKNKTMEAGVFDKAESEILNLMRRDSFEKWSKTSDYTTSMELAVKELQSKV